MQALSLFSIFMLCLMSSISPAHADELATQSKTKQIWQLLDYLAVDYGKSVQDGNIISKNEYAEMQEFVSAAERQLVELPPTPAKPALSAGAADLRKAIAEK